MREDRGSNERTCHKHSQAGHCCSPMPREVGVNEEEWILEWILGRLQHVVEKIGVGEGRSVCCVQRNGSRSQSRETTLD